MTQLKIPFDQRYIKKFKTFVEKQSGKCIKALISERGKEYNSNEFDKFCEDEGITKSHV